MSEFLWRLAARVLSKPAVVDLLIKQATKTPYHHLASADGQDIYMARYWLFNPYDRETQQVKYRWFPWSVRLHFIHRADQDQHLHDHPWNARTIILRGGYEEERRLEHETWSQEMWDRVDPHGWMRRFSESAPARAQAAEWIARRAGDTAALKHGEYHRIAAIHSDCAVTLFITGKYRGPWGFLVDGVKVGWRKYLGLEDGQDLVSADVCPKSPTGEHDFEARAADGGAMSMSQPVIYLCGHCGAKEED